MNLIYKDQVSKWKKIGAFPTICSEVFDKHDPRKKPHIHSNHILFINNEISKAIMTITTRLRNRFLQHRSDENNFFFRKQRNKCVSLLGKCKKHYFAMLNKKNIADDKTFRKTSKQYTEWINLTEENNSLLKNCKELNYSFVTTVKNVIISNYENSDPLAKNINDPTLKAVVKWRNHSSIFAIASEHKNKANVSLNFVSKEEVEDVCFLQK